MPPKPFPYPISIGVDLCHVQRMERLVTERNGVNIIPLSRRLFHSRSELEYLKKRLDAYKERVGHGSLLSSKVPNGSHKHLEQLALARFLAGRWAAKEATIKAHTFRRIFMNQIMIGSEVGSNKPFAVIDPPRAKIKVPADIARKNGFAVQVAPEAQEVFGYTDEDIVSVLVGLKIREEDKRVAQISISHDGPNAVAVCMALDERGGVEDTTIDDENGDYLHKLGRELEDFEILQFYYNSPAAKGAESKATF